MMTNTPINVSLSPEELTVLAQAAQRLDIPKSRVIGRLLLEHATDLDPLYMPPKTRTRDDGTPVPQRHSAACGGPDQVTVERLVHHGITDFTADAYVCWCEVRGAAIVLKPTMTLVKIADHLGTSERTLHRWGL